MPNGLLPVCVFCTLCWGVEFTFMRIVDVWERDDEPPECGIPTIIVPLVWCDLGDPPALYCNLCGKSLRPTYPQ